MVAVIKSKSNNQTQIEIESLEHAVHKGISVDLSALQKSLQIHQLYINGNLTERFIPT